MSVVFDPFTGQIIDTGNTTGGGGGGSPTIGTPVIGANPNAILVTDALTNLADIQLTNNQVLVGQTGLPPLATSSPNFVNLYLNSTGNIDNPSDTGASDTLNIGSTFADIINIGRAGGTVVFPTSISLSNNVIENVANPVNPQDAANKQWVEQQLGGNSVTCYDIASLSLPSLPYTPDNVTLVNGDKVLFAFDNNVYIVSGLPGTLTWTLDTSFTATEGTVVPINKGEVFGLQFAKFDGTNFQINNYVRYFNGTDYWEQSSPIYIPLITDNATTEIFRIAYANSENIIIDYSAIRDVRKTTSTLHITTDGTTVAISDTGIDLNTNLGLSFVGTIDGMTNELVVECVADASGSNAEMKFMVRRWSDVAGGPAGLPSYTPSSYGITVKDNEATPTVLNNISALKFDSVGSGFVITPDVDPNTAFIAFASTFKTWNVTGQPSLIASGTDTVEFIAGSNVSITTNDTPGSKSLTINATGGASTQTVTLSNNVTNGNVTGFVVDPLTADSFSADIVIKRNIPSGISPTVGGLSGLDPLKSIELNDGSVIFYKQNGFYSGNLPVKLNSDGTLNASFAANMILNGGFDQQITQIIDVTEDPLNQVLAVFGYFTFYQGLSRNRVCFIDGDGNDIPDLYDEFGISTGGSGFNGNVDYASKIKYTSNISGSASPYGYIIGGSFDQFNGNTLAYTPVNAIVVSNKKGEGYEQTNVFPYGVPNNVEVIRLANKQTGTCSFSYGAIILPSIPWTDCSQYYINQGSTIYALDFTPLPITALQVSGGMGMPTIYDLDTNYDGSVLFCAGVFTTVQDTSGMNPSISLCRVDIPVFGITDVNNNWSITNPLNQNPPFDPMSTICFKISVSETDVKLGGNIPNSICNNFLIFNYDATVNNSLLTPYIGAFNFGAVRTFTNNFFYIPGYNPLKLDPASPNTYMTTMYGCYDDNLASLVIQGYIKTAGLSAGVSFDIDSAGQVKYTSSNIIGGTNFTMKYKLTTV